MCRIMAEPREVATWSEVRQAFQGAEWEVARKQFVVLYRLS